METLYLWTKKIISHSFPSKQIENETICCTCVAAYSLYSCWHTRLLFERTLHELQAGKKYYLGQKFWFQKQLNLLWMNSFPIPKTNQKLLESQNGLNWKGLSRWYTSNTSAMNRDTFPYTFPCSEAIQPALKTSMVGHPQLLWATPSSDLLPSQWRFSPEHLI